MPLPPPKSDEPCPLFAAPLNKDGCCEAPDVLPVLPKSVEPDAGVLVTEPNKVPGVLLLDVDVCPGAPNAELPLVAGAPKEIVGKVLGGSDMLSIGCQPL